MENKYKFFVTDASIAREFLMKTNSNETFVTGSGVLNSFPGNLFSSFYSYPSFSFSPKAAKLHQIEARLGMSRTKILGILGEAGYNIPNKANYSLTYDHLYILAKAYEKSLRHLFKRTKKQVHTFNHDALDEHVGLFSVFIEDSHQFDNVELFDQELNSDLIKRWVIERAVEDIDENNFDKSFFDLLRKLKFKLQRSYRDLRIQILSIILSHHYHIFPSEEDGAEKLTTIKSFSVSLISWTRKAIVEFKPIKAFNNERYTNFNTAYTRLQFI